jgi:hypothetical protein
LVDWGAVPRRRRRFTWRGLLVGVLTWLLPAFGLLALLLLVIGLLALVWTADAVLREVLRP